ncbi:amidase family protein [Zopfia rhizophila CBS 207.26]|uniref:Amidase family protein n=1 Tax=Zopfia rhizophila CBS 207.26 TaxID=1314779 RepID=A0A6A6EH57_9PEZI|nr:amidase family protein [Zopfia rhizophila CBS 207.26]
MGRMLLDAVPRVQDREAMRLVLQDPFSFILSNLYGDAIFELGKTSYLASMKHPRLFFRLIAILSGLYVFLTAKFSMNAPSIEYLAAFNTSFVFLGASVLTESLLSKISVKTSDTELPAGPFVASLDHNSVSFASVYRLYPNTYRRSFSAHMTQMTRKVSDNPLGVFYPILRSNDSNIDVCGVPSRIYSWADDRLLAGERVAIKYLYDLKGLQTSGGSQAWAYITSTSRGTGLRFSRLSILADKQYPFNPRGDGWLTCSTSSSGAGYSITAYDWLDFAIGSGTGPSIRRPAAESGTYGRRHSQGLVSLERVMPLGGATDTAGVFSRDHYKWIKFSKAWYTPSLHQDVSLTGLPPLEVPGNDAEVALQDFIANVTRIFNITVKEFNVTATVQSWTDPVASNFTTLSAATSVINTWMQWSILGKPRVTAWKALFDGRFPPVDPARRLGWKSFNESDTNETTYAPALAGKNTGLEWYEQNLQYSTPEACSESMMLYDIGRGGFPSYRERELNEYSNTPYLAILPKTAKITGVNICPIFGYAYFTIPIGQMVPMTINIVVKRGCDFVLYNMIEKLPDERTLKTVRTGEDGFLEEP